MSDELIYDGVITGDKYSIYNTLDFTDVRTV